MKFIKAFVALTGLAAIYGQAPIANAQIDIGKTGTANSTGSDRVVEESDVIDWVITVGNTSGSAVTNVEITDTLSSDQVIVPGSFSYPSVFDIDETGITATSTSFTVTASVVGTDAQTLLRTLDKDLEARSFDLPTGMGDGWQAMFYPAADQLYFIGHHGDALEANCFELSTETACAGFPKALTVDGGRDLHTPQHNSAQEIFGDYMYSVGKQFGRNKFGIGCWDLSTDSECGWHELGDVSDTPEVDHLRPVAGFYKESNTEWWVFDLRLKAYCFNPVANAVCTGADAEIDFMSLGHAGLEEMLAPGTDKYDQRFDAEIEGSKIYAALDYRDSSYSSNGYDGHYAMCFDMAAGDLCAGWTGGPQYIRGSSKAGSVFLDRDTTGTVTAICASDNSAGAFCVASDGSGTRYKLEDTWGPRFSNIYGVGKDLRIHGEYYDPTTNRAYIPAYYGSSNLEEGSGAYCFDFATRDVCEDWGYNNNTRDRGGDGLAVMNNDTQSDTLDYSVVVDPSTGCLVGMGHTNQVWTFDAATGSSPCEATRVILQRKAKIEDNFCATGLTGLNASWTEFHFADAQIEDFNELIVIFYSDSALVNELGRHDYIAAGDSADPDPVDISFIDGSTYQKIWYEIVAGIQPGVDNPFADPAPYGEVRFTSDKPMEICFQSQPTASDCSFRSPQLSNSLSLTGDGISGAITADSNVLGAEPDGFCSSPGSVGDFVFYDNNANGKINGTDTPVEGAMVTIWDNTDGDGLQSGTEWYQEATTDVDGEYGFTGLFPGEYCVIVAPLTTGTHLAGNHSQTNPYCFTLGDGETIDDVDFGFVPLATIGDTVYLDNDGNMSQGGSEPGIAAASVSLYTGSCPGDLSTLTSPVQSTATDATGAYLFEGVTAGDYCVVAISPVGGTGTQGANGQDVTLLDTPYLDADFGFLPSGGIGDLAYLDNDKSGSFSTGDVAIAGADIDLYADACPFDPSASPLATQTTDANGLYAFSALASGTYCVVARSDSSLGAPLEGSAGHTIVISANTDLSADFGFTPIGSIGDLVYLDNDRSDDYDAATDTPLGNITVELYDRTGFTNICPGKLNNLTGPIQVMVTDTSGYYGFDNLPEGDYCVAIKSHDGYSLHQGIDGYEVAISGSQYLDADFGLSSTGSIGDTVYLDNDASRGFNSGDVPIAGANVEVRVDCSRKSGPPFELGLAP